MSKYIIIIAILFSVSAKAQHTVVLNSGEKINGVVMSLNNDVWELFVDGQKQQIQMKNVSSIFFKEYVPYDGVFVPDSKEEIIEADGFTVRYQMKDRKIVRKPRVSIGTEDKGEVVVKVIIDRYGNVRSAEPGASGSTTSNSYLYTKAQAAAKSAKFDENLKGPLNTEGTITIVY